MVRNVHHDIPLTEPGGKMYFHELTVRLRCMSLPAIMSILASETENGDTCVENLKFDCH